MEMVYAHAGLGMQVHRGHEISPPKRKEKSDERRYDGWEESLTFDERFDR